MFDELGQKLSPCHQANYEVGQTFICVLASGPKSFPVRIEWVRGGSKDLVQKHITDELNSLPRPIDGVLTTRTRD